MVNSMIEAAHADLVVVQRLLDFPATDDDPTLGIVGYHIQQAVDKSLKAVLESVGDDYRVIGHSIGKCLQAVNHHAPGVITDVTEANLQPYVNLLTDWETAGRYPSRFPFQLQELHAIYDVAICTFNECADYLGYAHFAVTNIKVTPSKMDLFNKDT